jgi:hypothetical protein
MLAANGAVDSIIDGGRGKTAIWQINAEESYHEEVDAPLTKIVGV